jgi:hypothetical protein
MLVIQNGENCIARWSRVRRFGKKQWGRQRSWKMGNVTKLCSSRTKSIASICYGVCVIDSVFG